MKTVKVVFDAYGTLFDVHSITQKCNEFNIKYGFSLIFSS
ncbi:hypothetical protein GCM10011571_32580 [Marinithermofilum abyssi]|uniref:2-haloacid dehalogenase n=1 Tax=Marinithermofilum abyssi TaxID=1571185 RepID=A0A8J2YEA4_9BACL|nr:hypothetical protein GCM10011571_32580 [Marinithermofilum abyssi]